MSKRRKVFKGNVAKILKDVNDDCRNVANILKERCVDCRNVAITNKAFVQ